MDVKRVDVGGNVVNGNGAYLDREISESLRRFQFGLILFDDSVLYFFPHASISF